MGENDAKTECKASGSEAEDKNKQEAAATAAAATGAEETVASSTSADELEEGSATGDEGGVDIDDVAQALMAQGKRNLVIGEIVQAVQAFQEASALLAAKYGETANECGEAYFKYGTALLELARMETGVLGNALDGVPDEAEESDDEATTEKVAGSSVVESAKDVKEPEREKIFKDVYSAMDENSEERKKAKAKKEGGSLDVVMEDDENGKIDDEVKVNGVGESKINDAVKEQKEEPMDTSKEEKETKTDTKDKAEVSDSKDTKAKKGADNKTKDVTKGKDKKGDGAGCSKDDSTAGDSKGDDGETAEDVSNFQLAWEMLELARVIFLNEDREKQLQIAHVHLTLGELSMETENYAQSTKDFLKCLAFRETHLDADSRLIAETHYNLGLVYCLDKQFNKSIESYGKAMEVIEQRIANLHKEVKEHETEKEKEKDSTDCPPLVANRKEIKELEELIPDITAKIEDAKEMRKNADDPAKQAIIAAASEFGIGPGSSSSSPFAQSSSSSAPAKLIPVKSAQKKDDATDVSHLMRKRKTDGNGDANESKKSKSDESNGNATNGHGEANGNGHANGHGDANGHEQKAQIKQKTVEDVLAAKECSMETS